MNYIHQKPEELFSDKCVVVVGGTSGIGLAIAQGFAIAGAKVKATGASEDEVSKAR